MKSMVAFIAIGLILIGMPHPVASEMSSANYQIYADSVQNGGGYQAAGSFILQDTSGELSSGYSSSSIYEIRAGYQYMERGYLSFDISDESLDLGTLSTSSVNIASTTITIGTDSSTGYSLSVTGVSGSSITDVADGAVTAGQEEYGYAALGSDSLIIGDTAVATGTIIASYDGETNASNIELGFKASKSASTAVGDYAQSISFAAAANI
ncbi:MAG: hypothetical protein WC457_01605 [Patescibacteria group bacterium]